MDGIAICVDEDYRIRLVFRGPQERFCKLRLNRSIGLVVFVLYDREPCRFNLSHLALV